MALRGNSSGRRRLPQELSVDKTFYGGNINKLRLLRAVRTPRDENENDGPRGGVRRCARRNRPATTAGRPSFRPSRRAPLLARHRGQGGRAIRSRGWVAAPTFHWVYSLDFSNEHRYGGLGIALTLARRIVELHDGRIELSSEGFGKSSESIVRLPLTEASGALNKYLADAGKTQSAFDALVEMSGSYRRK